MPKQLFYDLNVPFVRGDDITHLQGHLNTIKAMGYHAAAINHIVEGRVPKETCPIPAVLVDNLKLYKRITMVLSDANINAGLGNTSTSLASYDIVAVQPESEKVFQSACSTLDVDIISLDLSSRPSFPIRVGPVSQAIDRGIIFEIQYSPWIADSSARRSAIGSVRSLLRGALSASRGGVKRGHLLVSSGMTQNWTVRSPLDVINLLGILGINRNEAAACLTVAPQKVLVKAGTRLHTFRGVVCPMPSSTTAMADEPTAESDVLFDDFVSFK